MSRPWIPIGVVACCLTLAIVIAGWPDRHKDDPLAVRSLSTTSAPTTTAQAAADTSAPPTTAAAPSAREPATVHVIAFNASAVPGSAGRVSSRLKAEGYAVGSPGPDRKPARDASAVLYRPGFDAEAVALAKVLGLDSSVAQGAEADTGGWGNAEVAVVIGNDVARRV